MLPLVESQLRSLSPGEAGIILHRLGRTLRTQDPNLSVTYLERALAQAQLTDASKQVLVDASWSVRNEDDKFDAMYREFLRQQELVERRVILELASMDLVRASEMVSLVQQSERGYQRLRYGEEVRPVPFATETNTSLVATIAKSIFAQDQAKALLFFSQNFVRLEEPVFSPAIGFLDAVKKDPIATEQVVGLLRARAERLFQNKNRALVLQTHISLADFLARVPEPEIVAEFTRLALNRINENFARDFPRDLKLLAAQAYHQYSLGMARFEKLEAQATKLRQYRNLILSDLALDVAEFEKSQLTADAVRDPRKFAEAIRFKSREFGEQLMRDVEALELKHRKDLSMEEIEKLYTEAIPSQKFSLALLLNERLYATDPARAVRYLEQARGIALKEPDYLNRIWLQTMLFAQAINRSNSELLRALATDAIRTAEQILEERNPQKENCAVYLGGVLGPFFMQWAHTDFMEALQRVQGIPSSWLRAHLSVTVLEAALRNETAPLGR